MNNKFKTNIFLFESARPIINQSLKVFCCLSAFCVIPRSSFIIIWIFSSLRHCFVLIICLTCRGINIPIKLCGFLARDVAWLLADFVHRFRFLYFSVFVFCFFFFVFQLGFHKCQALCLDIGSICQLFACFVWPETCINYVDNWRLRMHGAPKEIQNPSRNQTSCPQTKSYAELVTQTHIVRLPGSSTQK